MRTVILLSSIAVAVLQSDRAPLSSRPELYGGDDPFKSVERERWLAESANAFAIRDRNPQAPVHILVISKAQVPTLLHASEALLGEMLGLAKQVAEKEGIAADGFRIVINTHPDGGQSAYHLHIHVLGGRQMNWPPG